MAPVSRMRRWFFAFCLLAVLGGTGSATAEDSCPPLTMITSVDMQIGSDGPIYVPAKINGVKKSMLVDKGGFFTETIQPLFVELYLSPPHSRLGIGGLA